MDQSCAYSHLHGALCSCRCAGSSKKDYYGTDYDRLPGYNAVVEYKRTGNTADINRILQHLITIGAVEQRSVSTNNSLYPQQTVQLLYANTASGVYRHIMSGEQRVMMHFAESTAVKKSHKSKRSRADDTVTVQFNAEYTPSVHRASSMAGGAASTDVAHSPLTGKQQGELLALLMQQRRQWQADANNPNMCSRDMAAGLVHTFTVRMLREGTKQTVNVLDCCRLVH